jgi:hypothetical protein
MAGWKIDKSISVRNGDREIKKIKRILFDGDYLKGRERYPDAVAFVNFRGTIYPIYQDESKSLFLRTADRPLKGGPLTRYAPQIGEITVKLTHYPPHPRLDFSPFVLHMTAI